MNLTDFTARIVDDGKVTFETRSVVGATKSDQRSPEFSDVMEFMVINPTWNVPRSITVKEYLPMLQKNPNAAGHLRIIDSSGQVVNRGAVDFTQYTANTFPFAMKQPPSDGNALGLVKFMFPNKYNIYLHDTPSKSLFGREVRAFSHGCIRLADPFDFAYALLSRQTKDPEALFKSKLATGIGNGVAARAAGAGASGVPDGVHQPKGQYELPPRHLWPRRSDIRGSAKGRGGIAGRSKLNHP